jgi:hypothetical protein
MWTWERDLVYLVPEDHIPVLEDWSDLIRTSSRSLGPLGMNWALKIQRFLQRVCHSRDDGIVVVRRRIAIEETMGIMKVL